MVFGCCDAAQLLLWASGAASRAANIGPVDFFFLNSFHARLSLRASEFASRPLHPGVRRPRRWWRISRVRQRALQPRGASCKNSQSPNKLDQAVSCNLMRLLTHPCSHLHAPRHPGHPQRECTSADGHALRSDQREHPISRDLAEHLEALVPKRRPPYSRRAFEQPLWSSLPPKQRLSTVSPVAFAASRSEGLSSARLPGAHGGSQLIDSLRVPLRDGYGEQLSAHAHPCAGRCSTRPLLSWLAPRLPDTPKRPSLLGPRKLLQPASRSSGSRSSRGSASPPGGRSGSLSKVSPGSTSKFKLDEFKQAVSRASGGADQLRFGRRSARAPNPVSGSSPRVIERPPYQGLAREWVTRVSDLLAGATLSDSAGRGDSPAWRVCSA